MKIAITLLVLVAVVQLSECFLFAKVTTPKHTTVRPTTPRHTTPRHTTPRHTTRRHFAYAADQSTPPDISDIIQMVLQRLTQYIPADTFQSLEGFWHFYYNNFYKVIYENMLRKVVAPVVAEQLKDAGITKNKDIDSFFATNIEAPLKQGLDSLYQMLGPFIDNFDGPTVTAYMNNVIENLRSGLGQIIDYIAQNKALVKSSVQNFVQTDFTQDAMDLMKDLKDLVKKDIAA
jgi:hypothetical protein